MLTRAMVLALSGAFVLGCSAHYARTQLAQRESEYSLNTQAWIAARTRLQTMCSPPPPTREEYLQGVALRQSGQDPFGGCDVRLIKESNGPQTNDWRWAWAPSYRTIVDVHEEELRKRVAPKVYEVYMLGLSRYLAEKADAGEITPVQLGAAFNSGWTWMYSEMEKENLLLRQNLEAAELSDAATWNALGNVATGLAVVATEAIVASAAVQASRPSPVNCTASQIGNFVNVTCY